MKTARAGMAAAVMVAAAVGLSGCGAVGVGSDADARGAAESGRAADAEGTPLPPGVLPPNDPPLPGDARLGPDGHYDYSAPDFVLKNPCDTEYFQRALELGWQPPVVGPERRDEPDTATCSLINDSTGLALVNFKSSAPELMQQGYAVETHGTATHSLLLAKGEALLGESCFAGIETEAGLIGAMSGTGGFSQFTNIDDACTEAIESIIPILGGN